MWVMMEDLGPGPCLRKSLEPLVETGSVEARGASEK
jgi:hypothetical protein